MNTKLNFITKGRILFFFLFTTSLTLAQSKVTISGTFFNIYYPNGEHLFSNAATHTIPASSGHIEVTLPPEVLIMIYQTQLDGQTIVLFNNQYLDRSESKTHIIYAPYGGPDYRIELIYPSEKMVNLTILYNIDFYYYNTLYAPDIEPNDNKETAITMSENTSYEGWGHSYATRNQNTYDYYKVTAKKRGTYTINALSHATISPSTAKTSLIYMGEKKHYNLYDSETEGKTSLKIFCVDKDDEFYILANPSYNSYKLYYTVEESLDENDIEPNNTFETAIELTENSISIGTIGYGEMTNLLPKDSEDFYKITPTKNGKLIVNFKEKIAVSDNFVTIYEKLANENFLRTIDRKDLNEYIQTFTVDCASPDKTYYVKIDRTAFYAFPSYSCCNAYEVSWNIQNTTNAGCGFASTSNIEYMAGINIYPNPTSSILNIQSADGAIIDSVILFDLTGRIILQQTKSPNQINVEILARGIYIIEVTTGDKKRISKFEKK